MALSIAQGDITLGSLQTEKTGVAYFAVDEKDQYVQEKFNNIREFQRKHNIPENMEFGFKMNRLSEGGYEQIIDYIDRKPQIKFIVIDTLGRVRKRSGMGNAYEVDVEAIGQLQDICKEKNVSMLLLHHNKKGKSEDFIENLSGSMGISGTVDTILALERSRGETEGTLKVTGRLIKDEKDLSIKFNKDLLSWEILGDSELYRQSKERKELIDILLKENYPMTNKDLQAVTGMNYSTIKGLTWRMAKDGILLKINNGAYVISPSILWDKNLNLLNPINLLNPFNPLNPEQKDNGLKIDINSLNLRKLNIEVEEDEVDRVEVDIKEVNPENLNNDGQKNTQVDRVDAVDISCSLNQSIFNDTSDKKVTCSDCAYGIGKSKIGLYNCSLTGKCDYRGNELHNCNRFSPVSMEEEEIIEAPF